MSGNIGFQSKAFTASSAIDTYVLFMAGEINLNQNSLLDNLEVSWFNYNSDNFPDSVEVALSTSAHTPTIKNHYLMGNISLVPTFWSQITVESITIMRQSYSLINKQLDNNGWIVSERALLGIPTP